MDAGEFAEWMAYDALEPFGPMRGDVQAGLIASTLANVHRGKGTPPYKIKDFMPVFDKPEPDHVSLSRRLRTAFLNFNARRKVAGREKDS
jgi:hypothetical protein